MLHFNKQEENNHDPEHGEGDEKLIRYNNPQYNQKLERLYLWMKGEAQLPVKMIIIPTNRCNLGCFACPNSVARREGRFKEEEEIGKDVWMRIVDEGLDAGVHEWRLLGGGEPMLRRETTMAIIKRVKGRDLELNCEVISNGSLFKDEDVEDLVRLRFDMLLMSIDNPREEIHDYLRGTPETLVKAKRTLRGFQKYKARYDTDKPYIKVNYVTNSVNYRDLSDMVRFVHDHGAEELAIHPMREYEETRHQVQHLKMNVRQHEEMLEELRRALILSRELGVKLNLDMVEETQRFEEAYAEHYDEERAEQDSPEAPPAASAVFDEDQRAQGHPPQDPPPTAEPRRDEPPAPFPGPEPPPPEAREDRPRPEGPVVEVTGITGEEGDVREIPILCFEPFYSILIDPKGDTTFCCTEGMGDPAHNLANRSLESIWFSPYFVDAREKMLANDPAFKCLNCGLYDMTAELKTDLNEYIVEVKKDPTLRII